MPKVTTAFAALIVSACRIIGSPEPTAGMRLNIGPYGTSAAEQFVGTPVFLRAGAAPRAFEITAASRDRPNDIVVLSFQNGLRAAGAFPLRPSGALSTSGNVATLVYTRARTQSEWFVTVGGIITIRTVTVNRVEGSISATAVRFCAMRPDGRDAPEGSCFPDQPPVAATDTLRLTGDFVAVAGGPLVPIATRGWP